MVESNDQVAFLFREIHGFGFSSHIELVYRGSRDGWMFKDFHARADNKGPTLTLIRTKTGRLCGGFTKVPWQSLTSGDYFKDSHAFIFTLDSMQKYPPQNNARSVWNSANSGPNFGGGALELRREPMNKEYAGACLVMGQESFNQYRIPKDTDGNSVLTSEGKNGSKAFTCDEIEIYSIN